MSLEDLRNQSFQAKTFREWKKKAEETLKGKTIDSLQSSTYENIHLKPLYSREDDKLVPGFPGSPDYRRGIFPLGYITNNWKVAQRISYKTPEELKNKLHEAIKSGQTALAFDLSTDLFTTNTKEGLRELLEDLYEKYPFALNAKGLQPALLAELVKLVQQEGGADKITGYIGNDPISLFAEEGLIPLVFFKNWSNDVKLASEKLPNLRTVLINTSTYHQSGANAVQELGIAAASGTFYLQQLLDSGMKLEEILTKVVFQFSIGGNFFMELAKLRAARILWHKITEVYGAEKKLRGMHIAAETSAFTKTVFDPHVNILRAGNEAFSAVIGGIQYLHVTPFNDVTGSSPLSERVSRNTQNILMEEAHLQKVIDPAGGSWYVEALTKELASRGWEYFQQIEANGGMLEVLKSNWIQNEISNVNKKRRQDVFTRKQSIVGTNVYTNLDEAIPTAIGQGSQLFFVKDTIKELLEKDTNTFMTLADFDLQITIEAITQTRLSEPFEDLRKKAAKIEQISGSKPFVGMICLGELREHKARLDFMRSFLSAGGLNALESKPNTSVDTARLFVESQNTMHFCLCGSDDQYEMIGHEILLALRGDFPEHLFFLAGLPKKEEQAEWIDKGIKQFIHLKSNCYETVASMLTEMEVSLDEVTKA